MGILKPLCWTDWFSFTVSFCFMYFEDLLLTVYIFTIAVSSWCIDPFYHYEWPNLFLVIFLKFILFEITIVTPVHAYCLMGSIELRHFQKSKKKWSSIVTFLLTLEILVIPLFCRSGKKMFTSLPREIKWQLPLGPCSKSYKQVLENRLCDEKFQQTYVHGCTYTHPYPEIINSSPFTHEEKTDRSSGTHLWNFGRIKTRFHRSVPIPVSIPFHHSDKLFFQVLSMSDNSCLMQQPFLLTSTLKLFKVSPSGLQHMRKTMRF